MGETFFWLPGLPGAGSWVPRAQEPRRAALVAISPYRNAPRDLKLRGEVLYKINLIRTDREVKDSEGFLVTLPPHTKALHILVRDH